MQLQSEVVGLLLSWISVVFVIMKCQKILVMMEVYCYVDSTVTWCIHITVLMTM